MLGGFLLVRRAMLEELGGFDDGFRLYGEDIDLQYRAMRAGWERWYVPAAVVRHEHQAADRPPLADPPHGVALARHPAVRAQASGEAALVRRPGVRMSTRDKYAALADGFAEHEYADPVRYSTRRAEVIAGLGPPLRAGESVVDLCCADGIMAAPLTSLGLVYTGVDATEQMIAAARKRNPGLDFVVDRMEDYEPARARRPHDLPALLLSRRGPRRLLPPRTRLHAQEVRVRLQADGLPRRRSAERPARGGLLPHRAPAVLPAAAEGAARERRSRCSPCSSTPGRPGSR